MDTIWRATIRWPRRHGSGRASVQGRSSLPRLKILIVTVLAAATLALAAPAYAASVGTTCSDDGHVLSATAFYTPVGAYHDWYWFTYSLSGAGTGGKSNVNIRLFDNNTQRFADNSPDDLDQNVGYYVSVSPRVRILASHNEKVSYEAIFDEFGPDDRCTVSIVI
jgi:hypothetical protein